MRVSIINVTSLQLSFNIQLIKLNLALADNKSIISALYAQNVKTGVSFCSLVRYYKVVGDGLVEILDDKAL